MFVSSTPAIVPVGAIETVTGRYIDVMNPEPGVIEAYDIFWALSRQARFSGHTLSEEIWSVGQHSLLVASLVETLLDEVFDSGGGTLNTLFQTFQRRNFNNIFYLRHEVGERPFTHGVQLMAQTMIHAALLHDGTEAYLVDLPSPIKQHSALKDTYRGMESKLNTVIMQKYSIPEDDIRINQVVRWADMFALQIEAANMMPSRGRGWAVMEDGFDPTFMHMMPKPLHWSEVFSQLMTKHTELIRCRSSMPVQTSQKITPAREITGIS